MPLGKHTRTTKGTFRRERADSTAGELRKDYAEFQNVRGRAAREYQEEPRASG